MNELEDHTRIFISERRLWIPGSLLSGISSGAGRFNTRTPGAITEGLAGLNFPGTVQNRKNRAEKGRTIDLSTNPFPEIIL